MLAHTRFRVNAYYSWLLYRSFSSLFSLSFFVHRFTQKGQQQNQVESPWMKHWSFEEKSLLAAITAERLLKLLLSQAFYRSHMSFILHSYSRVRPSFQPPMIPHGKHVYKSFSNQKPVKCLFPALKFKNVNKDQSSSDFRHQSTQAKMDCFKIILFIAL